MRWLAILRRPTSVFAILTLVAVVCVAIFAYAVAPYDPNAQDTGSRLRPPLDTLKCQWHMLGTDQLGRDVLSRLIHGSRISLVVGLTAVLFSAAAGTSLGLLAGYYGGIWDAFLMRVADVQMAFPFILLALIIIAVLGPSVRNVIIVFAVTSWPAYARTVRGVALSLHQQEFVQAARLLGASDERILIRHILPNLLGPVIVVGSFDFARIISSEAALSFLGLGIPPMIATWGSMINDGREYLYSAWWIATFPGLILALVVVAVNFLADAVHDILDPRSKIA